MPILAAFLCGQCSLLSAAVLLLCLKNLQICHRSLACNMEGSSDSVCKQAVKQAKHIWGPVACRYCPGESERCLPYIDSVIRLLAQHIIILAVAPLFS